MIKSVNRIALRAGVVVEVRDQLFERSPFALNGMCHGIHLDSINGASGHNAAMDTTVVRDASPTVSTSKASRWAARAAAEAEAGEPQRQPDFSKAELSPDKPDFFTHDVASGRTPDGAEGWRQTNLRVNMEHRGVPGSSDGHSIVFDTPSRDKQ